MTQTEAKRPEAITVCPRCAATYQPDQVFCEQCGSRLALRDAGILRRATDPMDRVLLSVSGVRVESADEDLSAGSVGKLVIYADQVVFRPAQGAACAYPMWDIAAAREEHISKGIINRTTTWFLTLQCGESRCRFQFAAGAKAKSDALNTAALIQSCKAAVVKLKKQADSINMA